VSEREGIDGSWSFQPSPREELVFVPPDGCADIMLRFSHGRFREAVLIEPAERYEVASIAPNDALFGVRFELGLGGACLKRRELVERELETRFATKDPRDVAAVQAELEEVALSFLERWAGARPDWLTPAVTELRARRGNLTVRELAKKVGVAERTLLRGFSDWVGASPKLLGRTLRSRAAIELACGSSALVEVAAELGYADQAHLTRELRELWGVTPAGVRAGVAGPAGVVVSSLTKMEGPPCCSDQVS
jgi:AraC-like DNA-binding protein